jgi:nicotinamidase-related amidase
MLIDESECQLVLIDYQTRLLPAIHEGSLALANAIKLAQAARLLHIPAWATEQNPQGLGHNAPELAQLCQSTLTKQHFSAVPDGLTQLLRDRDAFWREAGRADRLAQAPFGTSPVCDYSNPPFAKWFVGG